MSSQLKLPSGRVMHYAVIEANGALPLLWIHGSPGSALPNPGMAAACEEKGVPFITYCRPGYGDSTRAKGRSVVDEVHDVQALLDHLGFKRCVIGGWSGGGPHVLACAARLPACAAALVVASVAPYDAEGLDWLEGQGEDNVKEARITLQGEAALQEYYVPQREAMLHTSAAQLIESASSLFPSVDEEAVLRNPSVAKFLEQTFQNAFKISSDGVVDDGLAFMKPWGFGVEEVRCPVIQLHGSADKMCPYAHGQWIAEHIPQKYLTKRLMEGEGHISLFLGKERGLLDELLKLAEGSK